MATGTAAAPVTGAGPLTAVPKPQNPWTSLSAAAVAAAALQSDVATTWQGESTSLNRPNQWGRRRLLWRAHLAATTSRCSGNGGSRRMNLVAVRRSWPQSLRPACRRQESGSGRIQTPIGGGGPRWGKE
ncbi:unnamed protein product, partial [Phaeothamnion confervicola]